MKKLVGLFASVALMTSGAALAFDGQDQSSDPTMQSGQGGSGTQGSSGASGSQPGMGSTGGAGSQPSQPSQGSQAGMGAQMGDTQAAAGSEVTGQVIKSDRKSVFLKSQDGAVVQLKVDKKTQFADPNMKSARDLQQGTEIRANFNVKGTDNIATSIQPSQGGMGGSGDVLSPDTGINQGGSMQNDTGGSGSLDQGGSGSMDQGGSMPSDTGGSGNVDQGSGSDIGGSGSTGGEQPH
jgi:hypothetical protein